MTLDLRYNDDDSPDVGNSATALATDFSDQLTADVEDGTASVASSPAAVAACAIATSSAVRSATYGSFFPAKSRPASSDISVERRRSIAEPRSPAVVFFVCQVLITGRPLARRQYAASSLALCELGGGVGGGAVADEVAHELAQLGRRRLVHLVRVRIRVSARVRVRLTSSKATLTLTTRGGGRPARPPPRRTRARSCST